ncbi:VWA domain-containing protein [Spirochaeta africana]|uniref:von Willebrand factor type A-like protein n=1 Tax=Spirochaeta africana (strain ATCC 700263 / DSM 8902 / Z-7692) TaxID=889378 RepID=H9UMX9_SPIAZ|nr:VWA domain-containing protein [Spirochaeta africana]AFG38872.1 von Willebrand factor type A-like protein [Spirochaeta africana DSM 8902]
MRKRIHTTPLLIALVLLLILPTGILSADQVSITQVNPGRLLTRQSVELYLSILDENNIPVDGLGSQDFELFESEDGENFIPVPITDFSAHAMQETGVNYFLLIDNSGSMYETMEGEITDNPAEMRITYAKQALRIFLQSVDDRRDRVQLASFNTRFHLHSEMTHDTQELLSAVDRIERPEPGTGEGWTENYYAIKTATSYLDRLPGRNVLIMLSDGENFPYMVGSGDPHPEFGERIYTLEESIEALQYTGISLHAIRLGDDLDVSLEDLTAASGGRLFDTVNPDELATIYQQIRDQVLREYRVQYRAAMIPSERRIVQVRYTGGTTPATAERTYFAGTLFGMPGQPHPAALIVPLLLAIAGLIALTRISFVNRRTTANLEIIDGSSMTKVMPITQNKTVIGSADADDVTLVNSPGARPSHATVIYDPDDKSYNLESEDPVKVNNQKTTRRKLEPGDVINVGGTMVVFDEPEHPDLSLDTDSRLEPDFGDFPDMDEPEDKS